MNIIAPPIVYRNTQYIYTLSHGKGFGGKLLKEGLSQINNFIQNL